MVTIAGNSSPERTSNLLFDRLPNNEVRQLLLVLPQAELQKVSASVAQSGRSMTPVLAEARFNDADPLLLQAMREYLKVNYEGQAQAALQFLAAKYKSELLPLQFAGHEVSILHSEMGSVQNHPIHVLQIEHNGQVARDYYVDSQGQLLDMVFSEKRFKSDFIHNHKSDSAKFFIVKTLTAVSFAAQSAADSGDLNRHPVRQ